MKLLLKTTGTILLISLFLILTSSNLHAQDQKSAGDLIWGDEFDGTGAPDLAKWERQEYNRRNNPTGPDGWWSKDDAYLDGNGNLVIRVREIENKNADDDSLDYSVGMVRSKGRFEHLYGKYEIRCKLPTQPGWWVAFWMMQGNVGAVGNEGVDGTEVDIMEGFGWTNKINYAFHWDGYGDFHKSIGKQLYPAGIREGFHTFAMEWYPEMYIFFIDGVEKWRSTGGGVCNKKGYVKVTGEISTESWAINNYWANNPANAVYPDSFIVDYVRVFDVGEYQYPAGTQDISGIKKVSLYPNPGNEQVTISWNSGEISGEPEISIINSLGQTVKTFSQVRNNTSLWVEDLAKGTYIIKIQLKNNHGFLKFIKT